MGDRGLQHAEETGNVFSLFANNLFSYTFNSKAGLMLILVVVVSFLEYHRLNVNF